jgi:uncharacterized protein (DUF2236 family)
MHEDGYFPRSRSMLRRVHEERAVGFLFGQRALMLGAMSAPLAYYGTASHTAARATPFQRLVHTAHMFEAVFFGAREEADEALAFVHRLHSRVKGELPEQLGPWPAGTPYSALDPELMFKGVVASTFDSAEAVYEALVRRLTDEEREALYRDYIRFGELFGMPREAAPPSREEFRRWWDDHLEGDEVFLTEEAKWAGHMTGFEIPVPRVNQPAMRVLEFLLRGTLPRRARELYGLRWSRLDRRAFDALTPAIRRGAPIAPGLLRRGRCEYFYDLVAKEERKRIRSGRPTPTYESIEAKVAA